MNPMDLRMLPPDLDAAGRCDERRKRVEAESGSSLEMLQTNAARIGGADERNCEQMIGSVPLPVGIAGPLKVILSDGTPVEVLLPLATTEGALVASVNRGCKALSKGVSAQSSVVGTTRSLAFKVKGDCAGVKARIEEEKNRWIAAAEGTSGHLKVLSFDVAIDAPYVFLILACDTGDAMGMNMVTLAGEAAGRCIEELHPEAEFVTVAGNVDSDKKPSLRTYEEGRGIEVTATAWIDRETIADVLKSNTTSMLAVADAKLTHGSSVANAIGSNLHAANIVAALYLATGQDAAHVVEGSLADTLVEEKDGGLQMTVRLPALLVGVLGGGTELPAQKQCLNLLIQQHSGLPGKIQLAETIGAAVLAGELSLLAAQASHSLGTAHRTLGRKG